MTHDTVPQFEVSYTLHNEVDDVISVSYDTTWVHEPQAGEAGAELRVVSRWGKTDGTAFIDLLAGSVVLEQVTSGVTRIALQEHLRASLRDEQTLVDYLTDLYDETVLATHGEPLPNYD